MIEDHPIGGNSSPDCLNSKIYFMSRKKAKVMLDAEGVLDADQQIADVEEQELTADEKAGFDLSLLCESADDPTTNPSINYPQLVNNFASHYSMDDLIPPPPITDDEANLLKDGEEE